MVIAEANQGQGLLMRCRKNHGFRQNLPLAVVVAIDPAVGWIGQDFFGSEDFDQSGDEGRG
jgi:hypothetical protein